MRLESRYRILEKAGSGGMATVYRARDTLLDREVAIKVLHPHLFEREEVKKRFLREAQAIARLRHKNIIEIYDYKSSDEDCYIVSEFIRGRDLAEFLAEYDICSPFIAAMIGSVLSDAIGHAHQNGVIHRDIKPENILISSENILKITDFGIAQIADAESLTITGSITGSPAHMSPEQIDGKDVDIRTDIFSVGTVLYLIACGELPFKGNSPSSIFKSILMGEFIEPSELNPLIGKEFSAIIHKALKKNVAERYSSTEELRSDLIQYLKEYGITNIDEELRDFFLDPLKYLGHLNNRISGHLKKRLSNEGSSSMSKIRAQELINLLLVLNPEDKESQSLFVRFKESSDVGSKGVALRFWGFMIIVFFTGVFLMYGVYRGIIWGRADRGETEIFYLIDILTYADISMQDDLATMIEIESPNEEEINKRSQREMTGEIKKVKKRLEKRGAKEGPQINNGQALIPTTTGELRLFIKPYGDVYLDGKLYAKEKTSLTIKATAGKHTVKVRNPFFFDIEKEVDFISGVKNELRLVFDKIKPAKIFISSDVDCDIYIDGSFMGRSDIIMKNGITIPIKTQNGRRQISIKATREGYKDFIEDFEIFAGESKNIQIKLRPK